MAVPTLQELVDAARQAQLDLLQTGKRVTVNGRTYEMDDLTDLEDFIGRLEAQIAREERGGIRVDQVVPRG